MKAKLVKALEEGLVLGVKYSIITLVVLFLAFQIFQVRQAALNGQLAYEFLLKAQQAQSKQEGVKPNGEAK